jgi:hypothetical protein
MADMSSNDWAIFADRNQKGRILARIVAIAEDILDVKLDKALVRKYAIRFSFLYTLTGLVLYVASEKISAAIAPF